MSLFESGIRPAIDAHLLKLSQERRDYGDYWSASSAGYCMRRVIFDRLRVPYVKEDARKQRVFTSGHIFHEWIQKLTRDAGLSIVQELELQDEDLMVRGHIDDLVLVREELDKGFTYEDHLILMDYKTRNSKNFSYAKKPSHYHKMQLGTYLYMLRKGFLYKDFVNKVDVKNLTEARTLNISKDDLRMTEVQYMWTPALEKEVVGYWSTLNGYWKNKTLPKCTCADYENGFLAKEAYNPYFHEGEPCSEVWAKAWLGGWK